MKKVRQKIVCTS